MTRRRAGFTLIELLIVIVIIGILATIAIPRFTNVRERAYFQTMMSDLRNLSAQQEIYYSRPTSSFSYASDLTSLGMGSSMGVTLSLAGANTLGWQATATHVGLTAAACGIYHGTPSTPPPAYLDVPGVVKCTNDD